MLPSIVGIITTHELQIPIKPITINALTLRALNIAFVKWFIDLAKMLAQAIGIQK